ncbi:hypothetical protein IAT38_003811 [Cryptococcus sp. DSM 104549]
MRVTKPSWVEHTGGEKKNKCPIYSISVHPDGTRLATGGLDHKVKIWNTVPILDEAAEKNESDHKLLCTMSSHTGPVLSVRWAHHGKFLATGSDDQVIMIWGMDQDGGGRLWGSDEVNVENWKALTRLVGHVADVVDLAWSRDDSLLASVGLDSAVWIWDGRTFDRLRKLDLHQGFVKGVCWDPVGNFLATQSDDRTVKIWNAEDWSLVKSVEKPFVTSPQSTFFRRLSWSPDGAFIAASNAMNGPVFVAAVIEREGGWGSDISFVGHENTIQVAAFNPHLFFRAGDDKARANASTMLALGANDFSISIWRNTMHRPLVVLKDIFGRDLMDLCWSNDGFTLYGSSVDGSICAIHFDEKEFPELADAATTDAVLKEYNYTPPQRHPQNTGLASNLAGGSFANGFGPSTTTSTTVNVLQPRKGKAKPRRVGLTNAAAASSERSFQPPAPPDPFSAPIQGFASASAAQESTARMFQDAHAAFGAPSPGDLAVSLSGGKRKADVFDDDSLRGRTMAMTPSRQGDAVQVLRAPLVASSSGGASSSNRALPIPQIQTLVRAAPSDNTGVYFEARNASRSQGPTTLMYGKAGQELWVDYASAAVLAVVVTTAFCAAACEDGSVRVYSPAGRHLSNIKLTAPAYDLKGREDMLLVITSDSHARVFNTFTGKAVFSPAPFSHLLESASSSQPLDVLNSSVRPNGVPIIVTSEPRAYAYDPALLEWTDISTPWWINESPLTGGPPGPLTDIENAVAAAVGSGKERADRHKPKWWDESLGMGHYETKLRACVLLESKEEYQYWLLQYVQYLGNENFMDRATELVKELIGPIYHQPTNVDWEPTMFGTQKRTIAELALRTLARTTHGGTMAALYIGVLQKIEAEGKRW